MSPSLQLQSNILVVIVLILSQQWKEWSSWFSSHFFPMFTAPWYCSEKICAKPGFMSPHKLCSWRTTAACLRCFCNWRGRLWLGFVFVENKFNHFYCKDVMKNDLPWDLETSSFILVIHHKAMKHITLIFNIQKYCWGGPTLPNCIKT